MCIFFSHLFQCVNVLRVVSQELAMLLDASDELVTGTWTELPWIDFSSKLEEGPRIFAEIVNVKHSLRIRKVGKIDGQSSIDAISRSKIWNPARHRNPSSGQYDDLFGVTDKLHYIFQSVDICQFLSSRRLSHHVQNDLPKG